MSIWKFLHYYFSARMEFCGFSLFLFTVNPAKCPTPTYDLGICLQNSKQKGSTRRTPKLGIRTFTTASPRQKNNVPILFSVREREATKGLSPARDNT
jgi:hypothetical protein